MDNKNYTVNAAPSLTWNWLKSNCDLVELPGTFNFAPVVYENLPKGITVVEKLPSVDLKSPKSAIFNIPDQKYGDEAKTAQNARITTAAKESLENSEELISQFNDKTTNFIIEGTVSEPLVLDLTCKEDSISTQTVLAKSNSESTIVLFYSSNNSAKNTQFVQTKIYAQDYATVHIIKVQLLGSQMVQLDDTQIVCGDNAKVKFTQLELGGQHVDSGLHVLLEGYESKFNSNVAYLCQNNQYLDMNHIVYHYGKKSECDMQVNGTIKDEAVKNYRGTIDFKNGCCGAKGNEMEETLILSPKAVNKSLPVILCDEEDVEGEHGATIGRLSSDILFYMQSRGIDEKSAEQIMARAKIQAVTDLIPCEVIRNKITEWLENK